MARKFRVRPIWTYEAWWEYVATRGGGNQEYALYRRRWDYGVELWGESPSRTVFEYGWWQQVEGDLVCRLWQYGDPPAPHWLRFVLLSRLREKVLVTAPGIPHVASHR